MLNKSLTLGLKHINFIVTGLAVAAGRVPEEAGLAPRPRPRLQELRLDRGDPAREGAADQGADSRPALGVPVVVEAPVRRGLLAPRPGQEARSAPPEEQVAGLREDAEGREVRRREVRLELRGDAQQVGVADSGGAQGRQDAADVQDPDVEAERGGEVHDVPRRSERLAEASWPNAVGTYGWSPKARAVVDRDACDLQVELPRPQEQGVPLGAAGAEGRDPPGSRRRPGARGIRAAGLARDVEEQAGAGEVRRDLLQLRLAVEGDLGAALLVERYLSNTAAFVLCVVRRVKEHHNLKHICHV